jgi:Zn-dependent peptidase ImmA (M78 family)
MQAIAREVRGELALGDLDAVDPWVLAAHLDIPVWSLTAFQNTAPEAVGYLTLIEPECFSAVTVFDGQSRTIVHNDAHSPARRTSNVIHELSHGLLLHRPTPALDDSGCRLWDASVEAEASYLGGALLITEDAALWIVRNQIAEPQAAEHFGVSREMIRYRINITGARKRVARSTGLRSI